MQLNCAGRVLDLSRPQVMGVLNVTPDSFFDGGQFDDVSRALKQVEKMVSEGAAIIDVGGESTRPGADIVELQQELDRVLPVIEAITAEFPVIVSIDSYKAEVMRQAVAVGAGLVNDVYGLRGEGVLDVVSKVNAPVCIMHMQGKPKTMQQAPQYENVVQAVDDFFVERIQACERYGIAKERIILDPGFGFGKTLDHNLTLMKNLALFAHLGCALLAGVSRKSMIGAMLDKPVEQRLYGSLALATLAVWQGARIIRAHDVAATVDAVHVANRVLDV